MTPDEDWCERPGSREARTRYIMRVMSSLRWKKGNGQGGTAYELAQAWGMSEYSIHRIADEASRRIKELVDPSIVRDRLVTALDEALERALQKNELNNLAKIARVYGEIFQLGGPRRIEINHTKGPALPAALSQLSPPPTQEEIEAFVTTGKVPERPAVH
jgi:NAD(P)H-nitrite reductase large subunit